MPSVRGVRCCSDAASQKHNTGRLSSHVQATSATFSSRQIALAKSAQATKVTSGHVEGLVLR